MNKKFIFTTPVWGKNYIEFFLDYSIPSLLSPSNIPLCSKKYEMTFHVYTRREDIPLFQNHPQFEELSKHVKVILSEVELLNKEKNSKYDQLWAIKKEFVKEAFRKGEVIIFNCPDCLWGDGSVDFCFSKIAEGFRAVRIFALQRVSTKLVQKEAHGKKWFSNRELISLGLRAQHHDFQKTLFWKGKQTNGWPNYAYWAVGKDAMLVKYFHTHPIIVDIRKMDQSFPEHSFTEDYGLLEFCNISQKEIYNIRSSDEMAMLEVGEKIEGEQAKYLEKVKSKNWHYYRWARRNVPVSDLTLFSRESLFLLGEKGKASRWVPIKAFIATMPLNFALLLKYARLRLKSTLKFSSAHRD